MKNLAKSAPIATALLIFLGAIENAIAYDSGSKALGSIIGATDYYQMTCPASTDHVSLKIVDLSPVVQPAPQLLNAHVIKIGYTQVDANAIKSGEQPEFSLQGGNGKYKIVVDTQGTNLDIKQPQSYQYQTQCVYTDNSTTKLKTSTKKTIKNGTVAKFSAATFAVTCSPKKKTKTTPTVDVDRLYVKLIDTTVIKALSSSAQILNAQITKRDRYDSANIKVYAANAIDINGDANYGDTITVDGAGGSKDGSGDYFLTINDNGTNAAADNSKLYNFQFMCLTTDNQDVGDPVVLLLQDQ